MPGRGRKLAFTVIAVVLVFGLLEAVLRLAGFSYQPVPERIWLGRYKGGVPTADIVFDQVVTGIFQRDARLFWKPVAGKPPFNAAGLRDPDPLPARKPAGEIRLLALGDSCTFLGEPRPWTEVLEDRLVGRGVAARVLNAGVPAWTSLQGRRYLERPGLQLEPDVVLVYFGWNDHWRATVKPDAAFPVADERVVSAQRLLSRSRIYQALNRVLKGRVDPGDSGPPFAWEDDLAARAVERPFRVPAPEFEANLTAIVETARAAGARVAIITAPSALFPGAMPTYLLQNGFVAAGGEPVDRIHARYVAVARRVARDTGAVLVDAAAAFAAEADGGRSLMRADGIHLTAPGIERLARLVEAALLDAGVAGDVGAATRDPVR